MHSVGQSSQLTNLVSVIKEQTGPFDDKDNTVRKDASFDMIAPESHRYTRGTRAMK
jgi:hypothetical protein